MTRRSSSRSLPSAPSTNVRRSLARAASSGDRAVSPEGRSSATLRSTVARRPAALRRFFPPFATNRRHQGGEGAPPPKRPRGEGGLGDPALPAPPPPAGQPVGPYPVPLAGGV